MRGLTISILVCSFFVLGCSSDDKKSNNGDSNNGTSNNGSTNNGANNGSNNGTVNNGMPNNGMSNNGATNNATNNGQTTTSTNNGTTSGSNNSTGATLPSVSVNCAEAQLTECFSNFDCQDAEVCTNVSDNAVEIACCVTGERGSKVLGDNCTNDDDTTCESGICIGSSASDNMFCSAPCEMDEDCPDFMRCVGALGVCAEGDR